FFCSFLYLFYSSGRLSLITYLFTFVVADSIVKGQIPYFKIAVATGIAGFITLFGKSHFRIFIYEDALEGSYERMEQDSFMIPFLDFIGEFSFPFLSFVRALDIESGWLYFKDMIFWFTYALPARFFPIIESTSLQNTKNLLGETSVVAEVP